MDIKTRAKILQICGFTMVVSGIVGVFLGGSNDSLNIAFLLLVGAFVIWLGKNPDRLPKRK